MNGTRARKGTGAAGESGATSGGLTAAEVLDWIAANPGFLDDNGAALARIAHAAEGEETLDFRAALIARLRAQLGEYEAAERSLLSAFKANAAAVKRVHQAVLALVDAQSFEDVVRVAVEDLRRLLRVEHVRIGVEAPDRETFLRRPGDAGRGVAVMPRGSVRRLLGSEDNRAVRLSNGEAADTALFGGNAEGIGSFALFGLRVGDDAPPACLAFGAADPARFDPEQGTELLGFLARVLERRMGSWLQLPQAT